MLSKVCRGVYRDLGTSEKGFKEMHIYTFTKWVGNHISYYMTHLMSWRRIVMIMVVTTKILSSAPKYVKDHNKPNALLFGNGGGRGYTFDFLDEVLQKKEMVAVFGKHWELIWAIKHYPYYWTSPLYPFEGQKWFAKNIPELDWLEVNYT